MVMTRSDVRLEYFGVPAPIRRVAPLDPMLKRHLLAMVTIAIAALAMGVISYAMLEGIL
jgi:hypothetical protein